MTKWGRRMGEPRLRGWTLQEFLPWEEQQPDRYELVDGQPVLMSGGTQAHNLIAVNLISALRPLLRGTPCRPGGSDLRVPVPVTGRSRYPDVTIDCGRYEPGAHDATSPAVVFEVLSQSTKWFDQNKKLTDYDTIPSIQQYVCISQDELRISVWTRGVEGRLLQQDDITDSSATLNLSCIGVSLSLSDIYEDTGLADGTGTSSAAGR
jgi:Uma2 family endonuclease